ncbi:hypothetical protein [Halorubrum sp. GN11GM_10-3_MGM]|uniref:hypothetical protein n=1 Tax=Halorubrum sp. GN11GM_10-3_MGM TaxID=2518111 RepID=UPI0018EE5579|nr:hypothetical protein [Halorubrum sp. GN11GM_10-3_MGM]
MNRRAALTGLVGIVAGGGALLGTGAFTTVEAERTVTVETAGDADAFLGITPFPDSANADYVTAPADGTVEIDITGEGTDAPGEGVNRNAITEVDRLLEVTNNGTQSVAVGFNNQYAIENDDYGDPPGGWGYAVNDDESAVTVIWASPLPSDMEKSLEEVRPDLVSTGFTGSTLVDGRIDDEVDKKEDRTINPGESLHIGAVVDTRERTIEEEPIPDQLDGTVSIFADTESPNG